MNLHDQIMNLKGSIPRDLTGFPGLEEPYRRAYQDARHAFAELALKADALNAELLAALQGVVRVADRKTDEFDAARSAIAKALEPAGNP